MFKQHMGWYACITFSLIPVVIWFFIDPFSARFSSAYTILTSFGQLTGLVGMMFFSLDFILATRWEFLEQFFGGLNRVYLAHHILGGVAFILLLIHPVFLACMYALDSIKTAALFFLPGQDWPTNLGIASLFLMMALLIVTFFPMLPYQIWKLSHKFLGFAFFIGAIHGFFVANNDMSFSPALFWYMLIFLVLGFLAFLYRLFWKLFVRRSVYAVTKVKRLTQDVIEVDLQNLKRPMAFASGQFIFVSFKDQGVSDEVHPFSISSAPNQQELAITIKAEGDYTKQLLKLKEGAKAYVEGPFGAFRYDLCPNNDQIWIGGGIGITPFLGMAKTLNQHPAIHVDLYYAMHDESEGVYVDDLEELSKQNTNLAVAPFYSTRHGRLKAETIAQASGDITKKDIFVCGPPVMMRSLTSQFLTLGVPKSQIHSEEFSWE